MSIYKALTPEAKEHLVERLQRWVGRSKGSKWAEVWEAELLLVQGDEGTAYGILERLSRSEDAAVRADALVTLGERFLEEGKYEEAVQAYRSAQACTPSRPILGLVEALEARGDSAGAELALQRALAAVAEGQSWDVFNVVSSYASLLVKQGRRPEASDLVTRFTEKFPASEPFQRLLAKLKLPRGE